MQSIFCGHMSTWGTLHKEAGIGSRAVRWLASTSDFWANQRALQGSSRGDFKSSRRDDSVLAVPATNSQVLHLKNGTITSVSQLVCAKQN